MALFIVQQTHIDIAWAEGASSLSESCLTDEVTTDQLKMILSRGERVLVQIKSGDDVVGWGTYRIDQMPNFRALHITNLVAHNGGFDSFFEDIKSIAKFNGCSRIRCCSLPAQARLYKIRCNFQPVYTTLEVIL